MSWVKQIPPIDLAISVLRKTLHASRQCQIIHDYAVVKHPGSSTMIDIAIKPIKAAQFIYIPITI